MVTTKLNLSMTEPSVRQIYAKQGDTGRVLDITLDQTPEDGTLRILRPDGTEVTSEAVTGGEISESGETVTFDSLTEADVTELTVGIEPVQDLNGYDAPWVGGAGKNLLENTATSATTSGITFTVNADGSVTASGTATADSQFAITIDTSKLYGDYYFVGLYGQTETTANAYIWDNTTNAKCKQWDGTTNSTNSFDGTFKQVKIVQGHVVRMTLRVMNGNTVSGLVFRPMICKSTETNPTWQPYSNICPITGHDEVEVTRTGKNLADISNAANATNVVDSVDADGKIHFKDVTSRWSSTYIGKMFVKAGETYTLSGGIAYGRIGLSANTSYPRIVNIPDITVLGGGSAAAFITKDRTVNSFTANYTGYMYVFYCSDMNYAEAHREFSCYVFCNVGSTATTYEPYQGSTYTTSLGQTVYGGTLDMVSGVLTVDKAIVDLGSLTWTREYTGGRRFYAPLSVAKRPSSDGVAFNGVSSAYRVLDFATFYSDYSLDGTMALSTVATLSVRNLALMDLSATDFATAITGQQLVFELATPQTYTLTAQQIKTLVGTNNVWASSGDIISIKFAYGGLLSELPSEATEIVGKCYCDVEQNGVSSMPFTLNVKKNERES